jgi:hypothetical protein
MTNLFKFMVLFVGSLDLAAVCQVDVAPQLVRRY